MVAARALRAALMHALVVAAPVIRGALVFRVQGVAAFRRGDTSAEQSSAEQAPTHANR